MWQRTGSCAGHSPPLPPPVSPVQRFSTTVPPFPSFSHQILSNCRMIRRAIECIFFLFIILQRYLESYIYIYIERKSNIPKIESNFFRIDVFQDTKKRSYRAPSNSVLFYFTLCRVIRRKKRKEKGKKKIVTEIVTWSHDIRMGNRDYRVGSFEIKRYKSD